MNTIDPKNRNRYPLKRRPLRQPGQSADEKTRSLQMDIAFYVAVAVFFVFLAIIEWWRWYRNLPPNPILFLCLALIAVPLIYYKVRRLLIEKGKWELGRQGEIVVGQCLEELRSKGYAIFHDFQYVVGDKPFNIDHVVVSPHGIFVIETKTPRKPRLRNNRVDFDGKNKITISGRPDEKTIPQAIRNAAWLSNEVLPKRKDQKPYPVIPVVVYPDWSVYGTTVNRRVWVLNPKMLQYKIPQEPQSLTQDEVNLVISVLDREQRK